MENKIKSFKGWESLWMNLRMNVQMHLHLFVVSLAIFGAFTSILTFFWYWEGWGMIAGYFFGSLIHFTMPDMAWVSYAVKFMLWKTVWIMAFTLLAAVAVYFILLGVMRRKAAKITSRQWVRGARLVTPKELAKEIKKAGLTQGLSFSRVNPVRMPESLEPEHTFMIGRPGVGKTVLISALLEQLIGRGSKGIIYDLKGDYLSKYYDPSKDTIFNPLDKRGMGWSVLSNEVSTYMDVDAVAHSLIPPAYQSDPFWNDAARDVFAGLLHFAWQSGSKTNRELWGILTAPLLQQAKWLKGTKGGERGWTYIQDASSKQAASVIAVMMQYTKCFEYMAHADGDFSVKRWLEDDKPGFIFVTNYSDIKDTLKPVLSLLVDLISKKLLSMPDNRERRIWFLLDEFTTLQRLSSLVDLLTRARSKGGCALLGTQDIGQTDKLYTHHLRQSIVNACGTSCIFSVADPDTAKFLSEKIGDTEYSEAEETVSMGPEDMRDGLSMRRVKKTEKLFLPADIKDLKKLEAIISFPSLPCVKTAVDTIDNLKNNNAQAAQIALNESFEMKPEFQLDNLVQEQDRVMQAGGEVMGKEGEKREKKAENRETGVEKETKEDKGKEVDIEETMSYTHK